MAKLIVIEGLDASGKETQTELLCRSLRETGKEVERLSFPDYDSPSSTLVKMYLGGQLGTDPDSVSPYAAALFYAADRYISFKTKWEKLMNEDVYIVADRYVSSNIIYQSAKFADENERKKFISWLTDLEYVRLGLPKPDAVLFLNMEPAAARKLMEGRRNKITGKDDKDIHERDSDFLSRVYDSALSAASVLGWIEIKCSENGVPRDIADISADIMDCVRKGIIC